MKLQCQKKRRCPTRRRRNVSIDVAFGELRVQAHCGAARFGVCEAQLRLTGNHGSDAGGNPLLHWQETAASPGDDPPNGGVRVQDQRAQEPGTIRVARRPMHVVERDRSAIAAEMSFHPACKELAGNGRAVCAAHGLGDARASAR